ncbi:MAG: glucose 1-dehydrogenase [Syntrophorhabdales bacterium]|jgi:NAD(P)-dependent dehydrogenase (short-subunit alcohol dehydrogenase family)
MTVNRRFESKVVLVTGGTSGLGYDGAVAFAKEGAKVVIAGRRVKEGEEAAAAIMQDGGEALFVRADVSNESDVQALVQTCVDNYGGHDCAYNNAGIDGTIMTSLVDYRKDVWDQVMATNLTGMFLCMKYEIPEMIKRGGGSIVNMSALGGLKAGKRVGVAYITSKHGVGGLTKTGAIEYADRGIRVNAVCPGIIKTPLSFRTFLKDEAALQHANSMHPIGRVGTPEEISAIVLWLCSQEAGFVTGAIIPVDGGLSIT